MTNPSTTELNPETAEAVLDLFRACLAEGVGMSLSPLPEHEGHGWQVGWTAGRHGAWVIAGTDLIEAVNAAAPLIAGDVAEWRSESSR